uniref:Spaetzle domain-containing protein n=1 Tax=Daphnia galeata TaxID=27404 RepID=A0A8J2WBH4_9CRUS|nr:unnamed protein product [Daphnia galeata]
MNFLLFVVFLLPSAVVPNVIRNGTQSVTFCNPKASPPCIDEKFGFCISDDDYPMDDIQAAIEESAESAEKFKLKTVPNPRPKKETGCQTINLLVKPLRLRNIDGNWRVIVQDASDIFQREEIAICTHLNVSCQRINRKSSSEQCHKNRRCHHKFSNRKLLTFDPCNPHRGISVESFKLQSACDCRL